MDADPRDRLRPMPTKLAERQLPIRAHSTSGWAEKAARYDSGLEAHRHNRPAQACSAPSHRSCFLLPRRTLPGGDIVASPHGLAQGKAHGQGDTGYDTGHQLLEDRGSESVLPYVPVIDEYVWLDGRPVAMMRAGAVSGSWERKPDGGIGEHQGVTTACVS